MGKYDSIFVKTFEGQVDTIEGMSDYNTVWDLKVAVGNQVGQPPEDIRLIFGGNELNETQTDDEGNLLTLKDFDIVDKATVHMVLQTNGGSQ